MIPMLSKEETLKIAAELRLPERLANLNATRIFLYSPVSAGAMFEFLIAMMTKNTLPARTRELIILRLAWLGRSIYEFSHHAKISRELKLSEDDIMGVRDPEKCRNYDQLDRAVLAMTDDLAQSMQVNQQNWALLEKSFSKAELNELLFTVGLWRMQACWLNVMQPPLEEDVVPWAGAGQPP
jgi:4-carboxymuconolactone decarboxylase